MFKKVRCLTRPTQARQDAPFHGQGRSHFDARSVLLVREHERREERQVCEPEGSAKWRPAYAKSLQQAWNRWLVSRSFSEGWRLFSTFPQDFSVSRISVPMVSNSSRNRFNASAWTRQIPDSVSPFVAPIAFMVMPEK